MSGKPADAAPVADPAPSDGGARASPALVKLILGDKLGLAVVLVACIAGSALYLRNGFDLAVDRAIQRNNENLRGLFATRDEAASIGRSVDRAGTEASVRWQNVERALADMKVDIRELRQVGTATAAPTVVPR